MGIIPAGAGLTTDGVARADKARDHPRGCGAHVPLPAAATSALGSSPRVRGSPIPFSCDIDCHGIIPAGAGLTMRCGLTQSISWDHPRGCGAHLLLLTSCRPPQGSSPRVRGSLGFCSTVNNGLGIIPAGAGLTLKNPNNYAIPYSSKSQDHSLLSILTRYPVSFILLSQSRVVSTLMCKLL